jgi:hypothetical protein
MKTRRIVQSGSITLLLVLLGLVAWQRLVRSSEPGQHGIELRGGGKVSGSLLQLERGSYLLQTQGQCLVLSPADIRRVDGRPVVPPEVPVAARVERAQETFEDVGADGAIELRSFQSLTNPGSGIVSTLDWGLAAWEAPLLARYHVVDQFGSELPFAVRPGSGPGAKRVSVTLKRPVLPGERLTITTIIGDWGRASRDGGDWLYRMAGDYPDDRLVTRSVLLPDGARIVSVTPEPLHSVLVGNRHLVVWRRYFQKAERVPWEIRYRV